MITIELYCGREGFKQLCGAWGRILAKHMRARFFHTYGWWNAYLSSLEVDANSVYFFLFCDALGPLAILPTRHRTTWWYGLPRRELGSPQHAHMLTDIICRADADISMLMSLWRDNLTFQQKLSWDVIAFSPVLDESLLASPRNVVDERIPEPVCNYIDCSSTYSEIEKGFSKNFKVNLKKSRNRWLKESGAAFFVASEYDDLVQNYRHFLRLEASGWKGKSGSAIASNPSLVNFYQSLIDEFAAQKRVRINVLVMNNEIIAAQFCLLDQDTINVLKIAYDERFARFSPGNLLLNEMLQSEIQKKEYKYINLVTDAPWHSDWKPKHYEVHRVRWFNDTPVGLATRLESSARRRFKQVYRRLTAVNKETVVLRLARRYILQALRLGTK